MASPYFFLFSAVVSVLGEYITVGLVWLWINNVTDDRYPKDF